MMDVFKEERIMRKIVALFLVLALAPMAALGEETAVTANGVVESASTTDLTAPFSGVLLPFDWESGDVVEAGETLFVLDTTRVYAPADGEVTGLFAEEGDLCEDVIAQYGKIASIEKTHNQLIVASISGAYDDEDNRVLHTGETLHFEQNSDTDNVGEGRVIAVDGDNYTVELLSGIFDMGDRVKLYRDASRSSKTCVGSGTVQRAADVSVSASGRVVNVAVTEGRQVKKGELLCEVVSADADAGIDGAQVATGVAGVLGDLPVVSGQQVYKGQVLATVHDFNALTVVAQVDEMDLDLARVGDSLTLVFDRYPNDAITGQVVEVSRMGVSKQNATYYDVTVSFTTSLEVLVGMNATVWLAGQP